MLPRDVGVRKARVEHGLAIFPLLVQSGVEFVELAGFLARSCAIDGELFAFRKTELIELHAIRQKLRDRLPAFQAGKFQFLPLFEHSIAGFELHHIGIGWAKSSHCILNLADSIIGEAHGDRVNGESGQVKHYDCRQPLHTEPIHKLLAVARREFSRQ